MTKAQKNPYAAGAKPTPCPILVDPVQDKPTHYVLAASDPRPSHDLSSTQGTSTKNSPVYSKFLEDKHVVKFKLAALWHYLQLKKTLSPTEDVKLIGWRGKNPPDLIPPSVERLPNAREQWFKNFDKDFCEVRSLEEWLTSMGSSQIASVSYFAHGEPMYLLFGEDRSTATRVDPTPIRFAETIKDIFKGCSCGKFLPTAELRFFTCEAGLDNSEPSGINSIETLSVAACMAQALRIRTFGSSHVLTLTTNPADPSAPSFFWVSQKSQERFIKSKSAGEIRYKSRTEVRGPSSPRGFYPAEWWEFLPFHSGNPDWDKASPMASNHPGASSKLVDYLGRVLDTQSQPIPQPVRHSVPPHLLPPAKFIPPQ